MPHQGAGEENKAHGSRRRFLQTVGAGSAAAIAGVGLVGSAAAQEETIRLGGSMSLSGDNADLGEMYRDSYELAIQRINDEGGFECDGTTYTLEMELRDDQTDAWRGQAIYRKLIDREGIEYLLGQYASSVALPASAVAAQAGRPMIEAYDRGAVGVMPAAIYNELYVAIHEALVAGDRDRAIELHTPLLGLLNNVNGVLSEKQLLARRGIIETDRCREPTVDTADETSREILDEYHEEILTIIDNL
jgi:hypothetical protein